MVTQDLINAVDQALIAAGLLGVGLAFFSSLERWESMVVTVVRHLRRDHFSFEDLDRSFAKVKNGVEYEHYVAWVLSSGGWTPQMTPGSGDHGADIIASRGGFRVAVQCKLYSSPVGNTSVQEVYSAKDFYGCHYAVVVSNAEFTRAARKISSSLGVALLHHDGLLKVINAAKANLAS